jgi:thioredoxin reductase
MTPTQKIIVVGAGPVGSLAALYAANRGYDVEVYELRSGGFVTLSCVPFFHVEHHEATNSLYAPVLVCKDMI